MSVSIGIVGLPNVGKSTLFNAITNATAEAANYPFCTIEPNSGIVPIHDARLKALATTSGSENIIYATIEFTDIAGLVKGASKGEGLGNQFLANIRETSAIAHVVRCFDDPNIVHVEGNVDPIRDIETINLELIMADFDMASKLVDNQQKKSKSGNKEEAQKLALLERIKSHLGENLPVRSLDFSNDELQVLKGYHFLTQKKVIYVTNVDEDTIGNSNNFVEAVRSYAQQSGDQCITVCAKLEEELSLLSETEKQDFLAELGISESGLDKLAHASFDLLGLQTYLTTGPKESRAWTIKKGDTAPKAAGVIHTDFEKGFIRANILSYSDFIDHNGWKGAKEKGKVRQEGKEYIMQDGDVVEFLFNN